MMLLAKALYDNIAETPEELAFRRGDTLSVIERNTSGLDGWWLCSLKGRTGIVPGNRLKLVDKSMTRSDTTPVTAEAVTPHKTWHSKNKVVTPQRLGNMFVYDVPQKVMSDARGSDYDVPPSRSGSHSATKTLPKQAECDYDHPTSKRAVSQNGQLQKHSPGSQDSSHLLQIQMSSLDHCDVPGSNRSSTISVLSTGSSLSAMSSGSCPHSSVCESERSSLDLSAQDMYDVPPPARAIHSPSQSHRSSNKEPMYDTPKSVAGKSLHLHSKSMDICSDYDVLKPGSGGNIYNTPRKDLSAYDTPRSVKPVSWNCSGDSGISLTGKPHVYDNAKPLGYIPGIHAFDTPQRKSTPEAEYDTPKPSVVTSQMASSPVIRKTDSPGPGSIVNVYDVPPRVTKDVGEAVSQTEEVKRASSGSADSDIGPLPYDELRMELSAAMETLVSSQHCVNTSCSKLLGFVHPAWRSQEHLEPRVYEVKLASVAVYKAGELFLEFGQGALVNASKSDDKRLTKKLHGAVEALQESLTSFNQSLEKLNKEMWPLVSLVRHSRTSPDKKDDLDAIIDVTKQIPEYVRSISGLIQGNSMHLFKRSITPGSNSQPTTSTPKSKKSPPPTKPKPRISVSSPGCGVPMPKFTPKSPGGSNGGTLERASTPDREFDLVLPQTTQVEIPINSDYDVPKPLAKFPSPQDQTKCTEDSKHLQEYDYVSLSKDPNLNKKLNECSQEEMDSIKLVEMREKEDKDSRNNMDIKQNEGQGRSKVVQSLFPPPEVQTSGLSPSFKERLEKLQKEAEEPVKIYSEDYDVPQSRTIDKNSSRSQSVNMAQLHTNDRLILQFYATQVDTHSNILINAIEAFLKCIEEKQSPKTFIAYSKFVILAAHKLVYIGDTLTRHLVNDNIRNDIMNHAYTLCELLKDTVTATKKAALEFPGITSVQDMVDRVSEVSVAASGLKQIIIRFSS